MPTLLDDRLLRTLDAFAVRRQSMVDRVLLSVVSLFVDFTEWTSPDPIAQVTARAGQRVAAGQRAVAGLTDAYLSRVTSLSRGVVVSPAGVGPEMSVPLRVGQDSWIKVYSRLPAEYRYQMSLGKSKQDALGAVLNRAREMASMDLDLAHRDQADKFMRTRNVARFRRVIRPELSKGGTCGLCIAAADRVYNTGELMPIHDRCKCAVIAVDDGDVGREWNDEAITEAYKRAVSDAGSTSGRELKKVRYKVVEHGELGPQLRVQGQRFRGPAEVAAS